MTSQENKLQFQHKNEQFSVVLIFNKTQNTMSIKLKQWISQKKMYEKSYSQDTLPQRIKSFFDCGMIEDMQQFYTILVHIQNSFIFMQQTGQLSGQIAFAHKLKTISLFELQIVENAQEISQLSKQFSEMNVQDPQNQIKKNNGETYVGTIQCEQGKYVGQMIDGVSNGIGKLYYHNGDYFQGNYYNGDTQGYGEYTYVDGLKFNAYYYESSIVGIGRTFYLNGDTSESVYKNELMNGPGKYQYSTGELCVGYFKNDQMDGKCFTFTKSGDIFDGNYKDNKREGFGIYYYANGQRYQGTYHDDAMNGPGKYFYLDGTFFQGNYKNNARHGKGKYTIGNGHVQTGFWLNDVQVTKQNFDQNCGPACA